MTRKDISLRQLIWCRAVLIERSRWRSLKSLESGTILLRAKDGAYRPLGEDEVMTPV